MFARHSAASTSFSTSLALLSLLLPCPLPAAAPVPQPAPVVVEPWAIIPGKSTEIAMTGKEVSGAQQAWCSVPARLELEPAAAGRAALRITAPEGSPRGVAGLRVLTAAGVSRTILFMVDELPTVRAETGVRSLEKAPKLHPPVAVEGACEAEQIDYYRVDGKAGQLLRIEVVAQRLGSALDAMLTLLGPDGRRLVECDDVEGVGTDPQLQVTLRSDGEYTIEVRDSRYTGGPDHRYRLRLGGEFLAAAPPPIPLPEIREAEPNDLPAQATPVAWPCVVRGSFQKTGDRDWLALPVKKGTALRFTPLAPSLGSPALIYLQLTDAAGKSLAEWTGAGPKAEPLVHTFAAEGRCGILMEELSRRGGDHFDYALKIEDARPDFLLNLQEDTISVPAGGQAKFKVDVIRRGDLGPIRLSVAEHPEWKLEPSTLEKGAKATEIKSAEITLTVPAAVAPAIYPLKLQGQSNGAGAVPIIASTLPALNKQYPALRYPPFALDGQVVVGVTAASAGEPKAP